MARILKEKEHAERRNEILDVAQRLIYTKGYEQMSIQDILDELQISKGGFYHYFGSKQALLEALLKRTQDAAENMLIPIVEAQNLNALEKLLCYFKTALQWKAGQKAFMIELLRIWYIDDNAIVRQKTLAAVRERVVPLLSTIIRQGVQEGVFHPAYPEQVGDLLMTIIPGMSDSFAMVLLDHQNTQEDLRRVVAQWRLIPMRLSGCWACPRAPFA